MNDVASFTERKKIFKIISAKRNNELVKLREQINFPDNENIGKRTFVPVTVEVETNNMNAETFRQSFDEEVDKFNYDMKKYRDRVKRKTRKASYKTIKLQDIDIYNRKLPEKISLVDNLPSLTYRKPVKQMKIDTSDLNEIIDE